MKTRPDTLDEFVIKEVHYHYKPIIELITEADRIVDIGAHIGSFSVEAAQHTKSVCAYEPSPENYKLLCSNVPDYVKTFNAAVSNQTGKCLLRLNQGKNTGANSILPGRRPGVEVEQVKFSDVVKTFQPTIMKIDCEGAEYLFDLPKSLPNSVKKICIELHLNGWLREKGAQLLYDLQNMFPNHLKAGRERGKPMAAVVSATNWHTVFIGTR